MDSKNDLRRYTNFASLLDILQNRRLRLLDYKNWEDVNDRFYIDTFLQRTNYSAVYALCFTQAKETYHHWKVFSGDSHGVCVIFEKDKLIESIGRIDDENFEFRNVEYRKVKDFISSSIEVKNLPFTKRYVFEPEGEFRIIYKETSKNNTNISINIDISYIKSIKFSPWAHPSLYKAMKKSIRSIEGCSAVKLSHSKLIDFRDWQQIAEKAVD